jgi:2-oxoglutarate ferredoxin oxidoreductase subunit beta
MKEILEKAIRHKGFSVVEILTQCPTYFGRKNRVGDAVDMLNSYKDQTVPIGSEKKKENPALIERGIFVREERAEYCSEYERIVETAKRSVGV